jgi:hypothetical protein
MFKIAKIGVVLVASGLTFGCTTTASDTNTSGSSLEQREAAVAAKEIELKRLQRDMGGNASSGGNVELPPNPKAGECYARVYVPPVFETAEREVLVKEASQNIEIIPAEYEKGSERVMVAEGYDKLEVVEATYKEIEEKVLVAPAKTKIVEVPAVYEDLEEKILIRPARTVWKQGTGPIQKIDEATGEIMCLVEEPAVYETYNKRVLKAPATTKEVTIPAKYKSVTKLVVDQPATTKTIAVPPVYQNVEVVKMVAPAQEKRTPVAAEYNTVTERTAVAPGRVEWRSILCETNMTGDRVRDIQVALKERGFDPGPIDGIIGRDTIKAMNAFQAANNLPQDKYVNVDTLKALGVNPK